MEFDNQRLEDKRQSMRNTWKLFSCLALTAKNFLTDKVSNYSSANNVKQSCKLWALFLTILQQRKVHSWCFQFHELLICYGHVRVSQHLHWATASTSCQECSLFTVRRMWRRNDAKKGYLELAGVADLLHDDGAEIHYLEVFISTIN